MDYKRVRINRMNYTVTEEKLSGKALRKLGDILIPQDRDLFQIVPGHEDVKVKNDDFIDLTDGIRFFTSPKVINPGSGITKNQERSIMAPYTK